MSDVRCWWCGAPPDAEYAVETAGRVEAASVVYCWPPGDHECAEEPPSPLDVSGLRALMRIRGQGLAG